MTYRGDYDASAVVYGKFTTFRPSTGAAYTLAGTPALSVYKDNSTTQSTTGVTLTADFDSVTGLNHFAIDTSADGTFYAAGSNFDIVITTGTVDGVSVVGAVVASFTIRKNSSLKPTTAGRTLDVSSGGEAGVDWANVGSPTTTLNLSGTTIKTATDVETDTADIQNRLPAALVSGRMASDVIAISGDTAAADNLEAYTDGTTPMPVNAIQISGDATAADNLEAAADGTGYNLGGGAVVAASVTGNVGGNVTGSVGTVNAIANNAITAAAIATDAIDADALAADAASEIGTAVWATGTRVLTAGTNIVLAKGTGVTGFTDLSAAAVNAEVDTAISDAALATAAGQATAQAVLDKLDDTIETTSDGNIFTADALQNAPSGSGPSAADIADAVWEEAIADHSGTSGSTAEALSAAGASGDPWITALPGAYSAGQAGYILGTNLNATVSSRATQTSVDTVDGIVDLIKASTDNLPASPAATGDIPTAVQNADALLGRNVSGGSSSGRTVKQAFHFIRNKWVVAAGTLTVYDTDDSTPSWTGAVTGTPGADPVTGMDAT